jgi:hypothetical protein
MFNEVQGKYFSDMYYALTQQYVGVRKELAMQNNK